VTDAYAFTPAIGPPPMAAGFVAALGFYAWRRCNVPALLGIALEAADIAPATKIAWFRFQGVWRAPTVPADLCFVLDFAYPGRWLTSPNPILLAVPLLVTAALSMTNDLHQLLRTSFVLGGFVRPQYGPGSWIMIAYGMVLALTQLVAFAWLSLLAGEQIKLLTTADLARTRSEHECHKVWIT
jgi:hypothetical protein